MSDPSGGGVLHLVSEQKVTRLGKSFQKPSEIIFKTFTKKHFSKKSFVLRKVYSPKPYALSFDSLLESLLSFFFTIVYRHTTHVGGQSSAQPPSIAAVVPSATNLISSFVGLPCDGGSFRETCQQAIQG